MAEPPPSTLRSTVILSIDVGIRNLGVAMLRVTPVDEQGRGRDRGGVRLIDMTVMSLLEPNEKAKQVTAQQVTERAETRFLEYLSTQPPVDVVLVENQPYRATAGCGIVMKLLAHGLVQFFRLRRQWGHDPTSYNRTELVHARNKLALDCAGIGVPEPAGAPLPSGTYAQRKRSGVILARHLLVSMAEDGRIPDGTLAEFDACRKKDDCADAFLQGVWWILHGK